MSGDNDTPACLDTSPQGLKRYRTRQVCYLIIKSHGIEPAGNPSHRGTSASTGAAMWYDCLKEQQNRQKRAS
jgi:hypothetical protein